LNIQVPVRSLCLLYFDLVLADAHFDPFGRIHAPDVQSFFCAISYFIGFAVFLLT